MKTSVANVAAVCVVGGAMVTGCAQKQLAQRPIDRPNRTVENDQRPPEPQANEPRGWLANEIATSLAEQLLASYRGPKDVIVAVMSIQCDNPQYAGLMDQVRELLTNRLQTSGSFEMVEESFYRELERVLAEQRSRDKGALFFDAALIEKHFGTPGSTAYHRLPRTVVVIGKLTDSGTDRIVVARASSVKTATMFGSADAPVQEDAPPPRLMLGSDGHWSGSGAAFTHSGDDRLGKSIKFHGDLKVAPAVRNGQPCVIYSKDGQHRILIDWQSCPPELRERLGLRTTDQLHDIVVWGEVIHVAGETESVIRVSQWSLN